MSFRGSIQMISHCLTFNVAIISFTFPNTHTKCANTLYVRGKIEVQKVEMNTDLMRSSE